MSKVKFVVIHRTDPNNTGDIASNPLQYFLKPDEYEVTDIDTLGQVAYPDDVPIIVGGGGLLNNEHFGENVERCLMTPDGAQLENCWDNQWRLINPKYKQAHNQFYEQFKDLITSTLAKIHRSGVPRFVWGAGHNNQKAQQKDIMIAGVRYPKFLREFDLVGIRDVVDEQPYQWVPCASCMHPALRKKYPIKNDIIFYEHKKQLIKGAEFGSKPVPRFINTGSNVEQTIELIGSANVVLTNSYHGVYWATLLGKKVICVSPWASKFYMFKHQPMFLKSMKDFDDDDVASIIDQAPQFPLALDECINATEGFWNQIKSRVQ